MRDKIFFLTIFLLFSFIYGQVVINEVLYDPSGVDTGQEWIELKNQGASSVTLTGYCLYASGEHYVFPAFSLNAGAYVVVHWNAIGTDNTTELYTGTTGWSNMGNTSGSVVLFNTHSTHSSSTIIDFVEYGAGSQTWESSAANAGIWTTGDFVTDVTESHSIEYDGDGNTSSDWFDQATPTQGADNSLPVELSLFTAENIIEGVLLKWRTESEVENLGFLIERKTDNAAWQELVSYKDDDTLFGQGTVSFSTDYEYIDRLVEAGNKYEYRLADVDYDGAVTYHATRTVSVESNPLPAVADNFTVSAYPNPFNPSTTIRYSITSNALTNITIYDVRGRLVNTLLNKQQSKGWHEIQWSGINEDGSKVPAGAYIYRVTVGDEVKTDKLILLQ